MQLLPYFMQQFVYALAYTSIHYFEFSGISSTSHLLGFIAEGLLTGGVGLSGVSYIITLGFMHLVWFYSGFLKKIQLYIFS